MDVHKFLNSLSDHERRECESGLKERGRELRSVEGPQLFYRFAGYSENGGMNRICGSWWFSRGLFEQFLMRSRSMNVSLTDYARARLALPDSWNSKDHVYEMHIPEHSRLTALTGVGRGQPITGKREIADGKGGMAREKVFLIGGDEQYYFQVERISDFKIVKSARTF